MLWCWALIIRHIFLFMAILSNFGFQLSLEFPNELNSDRYPVLAIKNDVDLMLSALDGTSIIFL